MVGVPPVSSATVTASEFPRRRRRRAGAGAPSVPFLASNSATEMGRVESFGPVISCRHSDWLAVSQHLARKSLRRRFRQLRYRVCEELAPPVAPTGQCPPSLSKALAYF